MSDPCFRCATPQMTLSPVLLEQWLIYCYVNTTPPGVFHCLASLLRGTYGCQLKLQPGHCFPHHFGDNRLQIDFALVPEWQPTTEDMVRRSRKAPLCFSSPALAIGMRLQDSDGESCALTRQDLLCLAHATQPHLEALLLARHQPLSRAAASSFPSPTCLHIRNCLPRYDYLHRRPHRISSRTTYRYQSLVVDQITFPPYVPGERENVVARLRVIVALSDNPEPYRSTLPLSGTI
ncbi:hypothetical protein C8J57DRAFT_726669 [Mycena rebaudengoi]|nr:hypothetical protein C8J57DRAFT_726669 [Mycena rebaudengoi]